MRYVIWIQIKYIFKKIELTYKHIGNVLQLSNEFQRRWFSLKFTIGNKSGLKKEEEDEYGREK